MFMKMTDETDENIAAEKDNFDSDSVSDSIIEK